VAVAATAAAVLVWRMLGQSEFTVGSSIGRLRVVEKGIANLHTLPAFAFFAALVAVAAGAAAATTAF